MWKNVHPVYGAGIQTHDLQNMSLFPLPLDHGFRPLEISLYLKQKKSPTNKIASIFYFFVFFNLYFERLWKMLLDE